MIAIRHRLRGLLLAAIAILLPLASCAFEAKPMQFDKVTLPYEANVVEYVYKDAQGMMWFATRRGLFAYDGYNVRRLFEGNYHAIVAIDNETLCLGGDDGLKWLNLRTEQLISPFKKVPTTGEVRSLVCHNGTMYVGTKSRGLFCLNMKKHSWQHFDLPGAKNNIIFSFEPVTERMYIAHYDGLAWLDSRGKIHDAGIHDNVYAVWYDKLGESLWIGTEHNLLCQDKKSGEIKTISTGSTFNQIVPSPSGDLLLASEFGLKILNPQSGNIQTIGHDASSPQYGLPSNTIHQILCDGDVVWIATDRGIAVTQSRNTFQTIPLPSLTHSSDGNVFSRILVDSRGGKWLGGDNGLLHITHDKTTWFKVGSGLKKSVIRCVYEDRDKDIWIATDASIAKYDPKRNEFKYYVLTDLKGRNSNWAYDIYEDVAGRLWVATYMGGLYVVDKKSLLASDGKYTMNDSPFGNHDDIISTIYRFLPDNKGILWAYSSKGLMSINTNTMKYTLRQKLFLDNMILVDGTLWLDIQGRLYKYDTEKNIKEETGFYVKDGMIRSFVHENNRLWMSTSEGLFYIDTADGSIHAFNNAGNGFTAGVYVPGDESILWGGEDVICRQNLHIQPTAIAHSKVLISSVMVGGSEVASLVTRFKNVIELDDCEDIVLSLATFAYNKKNAEVFWYKIGRNGEWHSLPNGSNRIILSHLSGGDYRLYLTTDADHDDASVTEYVLSIPYPWYFRWWACLAYTFAIVLIVWLMQNRYKRHEQVLFEKRERERVMSLTQQKMDFFVDMSHELKTPLSLIIAPLEKLLSETSNAKLRDSLKHIHDNALRLNELIHRILDFKQLEADVEDQILPSRVDLCRVVSGCIEEFAALAQERNISIVREMPEGSLLMDVDVVKIQMVIRNILSNALKYVEDDKGRIVVYIEELHSKAVVIISDNGLGVPNDDLLKIFNRYYKGQNSREGSGIGLSVVKKYVEMHGGEVKAENKEGLKVTIMLPLSTVSVSENDGNAIASDKQIVLIVDDNREILDFLTTALESSYQCVTAQSGEEALKSLETTVPDIVITDQMMPGIDGTELCHRIRCNHSTSLVPIIMLTAKDDTTTELKSIRSGADIFMPKPFDLRKLQLHIVQLLNRRKAIEQNVRIEGITSVTEEAPSLTSDEQFMERVVSLINSNMQSEEFNVTKLCDLLCMDQKQLYRKLKLLTGETPVSFIRKQRLQRAAMLLKQDRFTVSEVMYMVGFSSASYFTKSFIKEFGTSPKQYK